MITANFLLLAAISVLTVSSTANGVYATVTGRIDCDENPDHEYCNGDKGKNGVPFCDLDYQELGFTVCRDRDVNPDVDCDVKSDDSLCNSERGRDGLIFCDLLYQETGGKGSGGYDRNDNPQKRQFLFHSDNLV